MTKDTTKAKATEAKTEEKKDAPKRKMLTPAERVAKLEAQLAEARAKTQAKDRKAHDEIVGKIRDLQTKRDEITKKLEALAGERDAIVARVPELVNEQQPTEA